MGQTTSIAWCDHTFNPWIGCAKVSAGCRNCYAEHDTPVRVHRGRGLELWGADAARYTTGRDYWRQPHRWNAEAMRTGRRARVFCASLADVFEDNTKITARGALWNLIQATPFLDWLLVTKRPENMRRLVPPSWSERWPSNVWAGTTVEDQERADERIPHLLKVPARIRFLSVEPMLEAIDLERWLDDCRTCGGHLSWVICGGESGTKARRFDLTWARKLRDQCASAGVPFFMKQIGAQPEQGTADALSFGSIAELHDRAGADPLEWPRDLGACRAFPA